jgi:hypothetical protein
MTMAEMTSEELLAAIRASNEALAEATKTALNQAYANALATVSATSALAATTAASANAAANQASAGAAGGVAGARTQSNVETAAGTDTGVVSKQLESDINVPEGWSSLTLLNAKKTYDMHQTNEWESFGKNRVAFDAVTAAYNTHVSNLNHMTLQALANNQLQSDLANLQAIAHRDLAIKTQWNQIAEGAGNTLTARAVSIDDASLKAIGAAVAAALANALVPKPAS